MRWLWWILGAIVLVFLAIWLFQGFGGTQQTAQDTQTPTTPDTGETGTVAGTTTVDDLIANPDSFQGMNVTVEGTVERVFGQRVMTITEPNAVGGTGLVVVSTTQASAVAGDEVSVSGTVRMSTLENILDQLGIDMPQGAEDLSGQRPIIVANTITDMPMSR